MTTYKSIHGRPQENKSIKEFFNNIGKKYKQYIPEFNKYGFIMEFEGEDLKYSQPNDSLQFFKRLNITSPISPFESPFLLLTRAVLNNLQIKLGIYTQHRLWEYGKSITQKPYDPPIIGLLNSFNDVKPDYSIKTWWDTREGLSGIGISYGNLLGDKSEEIINDTSITSPIELSQYLIGGESFNPNLSSSRPEAVISATIYQNVPYIKMHEINYSLNYFEQIYGNMDIEYSELELETRFNDEIDEWIPQNMLVPFAFKKIDTEKAILNTTEIFYTWKTIATTVLLEIDNSGSRPRYLYQTTYMYELIQVGTRNLIEYVYFLIFGDINAINMISLTAETANIIMDIDYITEIIGDISPKITTYPYIPPSIPEFIV